MCGRFALIEVFETIIDYYNATGTFDWSRSYNIAPTQNIPVVVDCKHGREMRLMKWGLVPHWAKDEKLSYNMINARAETVAIKAGYREAFKSKRCIIPASGFYEWKKVTEKIKRPYYFTPTQGLFSFCGLWSSWTSPEGKELETCAIITTSANDVVEPVHERMPVAITNNMIPAWLANSAKPGELQSFLAPYPASQMRAVQVSTYVSSYKNHGPKCIEPIDQSLNAGPKEKS